MTMALDNVAPETTKLEALQKAQQRLISVVNFGLDLGLQPDETDKESIREALRMVTIALGTTDLINPAAGDAA